MLTTLSMIPYMYISFMETTTNWKTSLARKPVITVIHWTTLGTADDCKHPYKYADKCKNNKHWFDSSNSTQLAYWKKRHKGHWSNGFAKLHKITELKTLRTPCSLWTNKDVKERNETELTSSLETKSTKINSLAIEYCKNRKT